MRRAVAAVGFLLVSALAACGGDQDSAGGDAAWAREADEVVASLAEAYDIEDSYETARFFSAGGTLDLANWGLPVATTPEQVIEILEMLWFWEPGRAEVRAEHVFVSPDSAIVWWNAYDEGGGQDWVQTYAFGAHGRVASRAFRGLEVPFDELRGREDVVLDLVGRYIDAWDQADSASLASVYARDVAVRDDTRGQVWRGLAELTEAAADSPPLEPGPWPGVFAYQSGDHVEAIVLLQLGGACPMLEARRWVLDGDLITNEARFTHVPSARRCLTDLPDGWWTTFELPPELQDNVTAIVDAGGTPVELVNAEPNHEAYARWMLGRFAESGIGVPDVVAIWFPPSPECMELGGLAIEHDDRYEGRHTVVVCQEEDRLERDESESGWYPTAIAYGLHELAHIWMIDRLDDETREAFNEMAGLPAWHGSDVEWRNRGVEHAAFTIAWGLAGTTDARYPLLPPPDCEDLAARFELLTGRQPITTCGVDGWSQ